MATQVHPLAHTARLHIRLCDLGCGSLPIKRYWELSPLDHLIQFVYLDSGQSPRGWIFYALRVFFTIMIFQELVTIYCRMVISIINGETGFTIIQVTGSYFTLSLYITCSYGVPFRGHIDLRQGPKGPKGCLPRHSLLELDQ